MPGRVLRVERDRAAQRAVRGAGSLRGHVGESERRPALGVPRSAARDGLEPLYRGRPHAEAREREPELAGGLDVLGMVADFLVETARRRAQLVHGQEQHAHAVVRVRDHGVELDRGPVRDDRRRGLVCALERAAHLVFLLRVRAARGHRGIGVRPWFGKEDRAAGAVGRGRGRAPPREAEGDESRENRGAERGARRRSRTRDAHARRIPHVRRQPRTTTRSWYSRALS